MNADASAPACIVTRVDAGVSHITLNRPETRNAMSSAMVRELMAALDAAEADPRVRVLVLRGAGGHFCAGGDIKDMVAARAAGEDAFASLSAEFGELCAAFSRSSRVVVAVLEGTVMGGGFGLACVADIALAGESASFRLPEVGLGLVPAQIAPYLVERLGYAEAKRLALSVASVGAREALALRLVHAVHPAEELDDALQSVLEGLRAAAPGAVAATKRLLAQARLAAPHSLIENAARVFARAAQGAEAREGGLAFVEKRKPAWSAG